MAYGPPRLACASIGAVNRFVRIGGALIWIFAAFPVSMEVHTPRTRMAVWAVSYLTFGVALFFATRARGSRILPMAVEVAAVVGMVLSLYDGYGGTLLVIVAMQLAGVMSRRNALFWIAGQSLFLGASIAIHWELRAAILYTPGYFGYQFLGYLACEAMVREASANAEIRALQQILADSSRIAERLRIARDLHDALGHHLTALTLNLEAALQRADGDARAKIATAQTIARSLLTEVREIVASNDVDECVDLTHALETLIAGVPRPAVHMQIGDDVRVTDPERARTILRCAQEIVTNSARHSGAENLWVVIDRDGDVVRIRAHDDGRGAHPLADGFGLRAMRSRVEGVGGELRIDSGPGRGFDVVALVPMGERA
jgi:signal transduction histidine kinase